MVGQSGPDLDNNLTAVVSIRVCLLVVDESDVLVCPAAFIGPVRSSALLRGASEEVLRPHLNSIDPDLAVLRRGVPAVNLDEAERQPEPIVGRIGRQVASPLDVHRCAGRGIQWPTQAIATLVPTQDVAVRAAGFGGCVWLAIGIGPPGGRGRGGERVAAHVHPRAHGNREALNSAAPQWVGQAVRGPAAG